MIIETKFSIGDVVWVASTTMEAKQMPCPDCLGTRKWIATSPAGEQYTFSCPRCTANYRSDHRMSLQYTVIVPVAHPYHVRGVRPAPVREDGIKEWDHENYYSEDPSASGNMTPESRLFATQKEAMAKAQMIAISEFSQSKHLPGLYAETLELSDYQLADLREHLKEKELSNFKWKLHDIIVEATENGDTAEAIIKQLEEFGA